MRIIVQKFGGTSVATAEARARLAEHVRQCQRAGFAPVVVVSAMGRNGSPYATDTLLGLAKQTWPGAGARELDLIASCGEVISSVVVSCALSAQSIRAVAMTGAQAGIITTGAFGDDIVARVDAVHVLGQVRQGLVPVVAGFQGVSPSGEITTLGRGGSDTTAAALASALGAAELHIFTDVDGVKTADPEVFPEARTIGSLCYDDLLKIALEGAKVVHPRAVESVKHSQIPMRMRSTFSESPGTLITAEPHGRQSAKALAGAIALVHRRGLKRTSCDSTPCARVAIVCDRGSESEISGVITRALQDVQVPLLHMQCECQDPFCIVPEKHLPLAVGALHKALRL